MWTSALHGITNFIVGDEAERAPAPVPPITREQWDAMTPEQQNNYQQQQWQHQQWQQQQQRQHQQQQAGGALMASAPSSPLHTGHSVEVASGPSGVSSPARVDAWDRSSNVASASTTPLHPASTFDSVPLHAAHEGDDGGTQAGIAPAFATLESTPAAADAVHPPPAFLAPPSSYGGEASHPSQPHQQQQASATDQHSDDTSAAAPASSPQSGGGAIQSTKALFARYMPALPFKHRSQASASDGSAGADADPNAPASGPSSTQAAVASARELVSVTAGTIGHALSSMKSSLPRFTVSSGGGSVNSHEGEEVPELIHALQQEEARSASLSAEFKKIIAQHQVEKRGLESELDALAKELKKRDIEIFEWKSKAKDAEKAARAKDAQIAELADKLAHAEKRAGTATTAAPAAGTPAATSVSTAPATAASATAATAAPTASPATTTDAAPTARAPYVSLAARSAAPTAGIASTAAPAATPISSTATAPPASAAAAPSSSLAAVRAVTWTCTHCGLENQRTQFTCVGCKIGKRFPTLATKNAAAAAASGSASAAGSTLLGAKLGSASTSASNSANNSGANTPVAPSTSSALASSKLTALNFPAPAAAAVPAASPVAAAPAASTSDAVPNLDEVELRESDSPLPDEVEAELPQTI